MRGFVLPALLALFLCGVEVLAAGPYISPRSIVNAASLTPSGLPGGSIARGSRFQLSGVGVGPVKPREDSHFPLKGSLGGVTITATVGNTTYPCWPIYVSSTLVRAILPSAVPAGPATFRITFNGQTSNPVRVDVVEHNPGLFSANGLGYGPGSVFDADDFDDASEHEHRNSLGRAHGRGRLASLVATGFGAGSLADYLPPPHRDDDAGDVEILVGGVPAQKFFVRKSFRRPGLDEVSFRVPDEAPHGCYVPVQAIVNGLASNVVTMAIGGRGRDCSDDFNPASSALRDGGDLAFALLSRVVVEGPTGNVSKEQGVAAGRRLKHNDVAFERLVSLPPAGTCTVYSLSREGRASSVDFGGTGLYLGNLTVANAAQQIRPLPLLPLNFYEATWGVIDPAARMRVPLPAFLDPGPVTLAGAGTGPGKTKGVDRVGPFSVQRPLAAPPLWTNAADVREVTRSAGMRVTWSGAGARRVFVMGTASDRRAGAAAFFTCVAPAGASELTVPATILSRLPAVQDDRAGSGAVEVGAFAQGTPARFSAVGLDAGFLFLTSATAQTVRFK